MLSRAACLLLFLSLTGCALVDPFVVRERLDETKYAPRPASVGSTIDGLNRDGYLGDAEHKELRRALASLAAQQEESVPLADAEAYAERVKAAYHDALRQQGRLRTSLGLLLIPLGAAALGLGATGANPTTVLATGLTGAAAFGTGMWLSSPPRQRAYAEGIVAVNCAQKALEPLRVPVIKQVELERNLRTLREELPALDRAINETTASIDLAEALANAVTSTKPVLAARVASLKALVALGRTEVAAARALSQGANEAHRGGVELQRTLDTAGRRLVQAVNAIVAQVDAVVIETQPSLQALPSIIGGLGGMYRSLTAVPEALKGVAPTAPAKGRLEPESGEVPEPLTEAEASLMRTLEERQANLGRTLTALRDAVVRVGPARRVVADQVNAIVKDAPTADKLALCQVKASDLIIALSVDPPSPIELEKPGNTSFEIKGGQSPYGASLAGGVAGLTVSKSDLHSRIVNVQATAEAVPGRYMVNVSDLAGQQRAVTIVVKASAPEEKPGEKKPPAAAAPLAAFVDKINNEKPPITVTVGKVPITAKSARLDKTDRALVTVEVGTPPKDANLDAVTVEAARDEIHAKSGEKVPKDKVVIENSKVILDLKKKVGPESGPAPQCAEPTLAGAVAVEPDFVALARADRERLQIALCLSGNAVDGRWGRITKGKFMLYQCQAGLAQTGDLTPDLAARILAEPEAAVDARCGRPVGG